MIKKIFALFTLLTIHTISYAQLINPCGGTDDDEPCPLDTWVYVLVFAFVIFGAYKMHQKQKNISLLDS
ncbi:MULTISPECIES: hypothetical protein [unclassified Mucilaginibacter]|uniref:hypothetical protein n=1 Tax=unclassified Mucilaginibacter TaxID=2617802 RepID=UPI002AC8A38B|nr:MULTISPECIES: hypothetical protein [unclassified Mucilaginibacter]MEB0262351.1 hypothetical protein [Mucilaginibacter sp. 10I4]MEB0279331.1 hypothetical protein [Mucilaginibacter sp. 10B2]MEB0302840.1 hypothetical protein [Mucilaginibacter sp. 5C4]WPX23157.1 hypothetical protein RHM67_17900 [Mucilaginibacter sp. 5C4]